MYNHLGEEENDVFRWRCTPFLHFNKTLLLMIRGFTWLFHGTEGLVESHSLQHKTGMKISSLSKHTVSPLLFFLWSCLPPFWHLSTSEIIFVLFQKHWCNRAIGNIQGKWHFPHWALFLNVCCFLPSSYSAKESLVWGRAFLSVI